MSGLLVISALIFASGAVLGGQAAFWVGLVLFGLYIAFARPAGEPRQGKKWAWGVVIPPFIFMRRGDNQR